MKMNIRGKFPMIFRESMDCNSKLQDYGCSLRVS
uniref:Uncharacterized protein n=1 Tax=Rhizophora mucronata TaxID=61149 RepID=A0A2P2Q0D2_RHIMU